MMIKILMIMSIMLMAINTNLSANMTFKEQFKQCNNGDMTACSNVGTFYYRGEGGVKKSNSKGLSYYQKSCNGGSAIGCTSLGMQYFDGNGVKKSKRKAKQLYEKACKLHPEEGSWSCYKLAEMYIVGDSVKKNRATAIKYLEKSCIGGYKDACKALREIRGR